MQNNYGHEFYEIYIVSASSVLIKFMQSTYLSSYPFNLNQNSKQSAQYENSLGQTIVMKKPRYDCFVITKAPPRVCMKNTVQGACQVVNTAPGKAVCYIYHKTPRVLCFHTQKHRRCFKMVYCT